MIKSRLKVLLAEHDISQTELAKRTGIRQATISNICTNKAKQIPIDVLDILCDYFNCEISDIFIHTKN